ncbi:HNH/ENDO VII family nuclease [Streptococcus salivarius]|uniref:HNH/ENDO VII family nuclease n=1 Tax=Streptococcus salivarius TaxID=1304 RepID=UPI0022E30412|nr:HNH/ENDO VII family nuclease [Streptococcus salivarius]
MSIEKVKRIDTGVSNREAQNTLFNPDLKLSTSEVDNYSRIEGNQITKTELTDDDRLKIMDETGWSKDLISSFRWKEEVEVYKEQNLSEKQVDGRQVLQRDDIDPNIKDEQGRTNKERMENGKAPIVDGKPVELHHIGQRQDSPFAELTSSVHKENYRNLHDVPPQPSQIDRKSFAKEKADYWKKRAEDF